MYIWGLIWRNIFIKRGVLESSNLIVCYNKKYIIIKSKV